MQGLLQYHEDVVKYFTQKGVSIIFLFRRNLLRRMVSILANSYDHDKKLLNGAHKSHVHSPHEVCQFFSIFTSIDNLWPMFISGLIALNGNVLQAEILASYKPHVNVTTLIREIKLVQNMVAKASEYFNSTRHMTLYYEDVVNNHTVCLLLLPPVWLMVLNGGNRNDFIFNFDFDEMCYVIPTVMDENEYYEEKGR